MLQISLDHSDVEAGVVILDAMRGRYEQCVPDAGLSALLDWLSAQVVSQPGALPADQLGEIAICDFDRCVAALYARSYQSDFDCVLPCTSCEARFEFTLSPQALFAPEGASEVTTLQRGRYRVGETTFRFPRVRDVIASPSPDALRDAALLDGEWEGTQQAEAAFAAICGIGRQAVDAVCPECDSAQATVFDVQDFARRAFVRDTAFLLSDVHLLACAYGWTFPTILDLPKTTRRELAGLVARDRAAGLRMRRVA